MVQKGRINQASPYLCNLFHDRFSVSGRNTRNKSQLKLPKSILSTGQRSFAFLGAKEYNRDFFYRSSLTVGAQLYSEVSPRGSQQ